MDNLLLLPLQSAEASERVSAVEIQSAPGATTKRVLRLDADEMLSVVPLEDVARVSGVAVRSPRQVALVCGTRSSSATAWFVMGCCGDLMVNGVSPLALMRVDSGALLSLGGHCWWAASIWRPQPAAAPAELADRPARVRRPAEPGAGRPVRVRALDSSGTAGASRLARRAQLLSGGSGMYLWPGRVAGAADFAAAARQTSGRRQRL